jgi:hypothetical protein
MIAISIPFQVARPSHNRNNGNFLACSESERSENLRGARHRSEFLRLCFHGRLR